MTTVKNGSRGADVTTLQQALNKAGGYGLAIDGIFGAKTEAAVRDFQKKKGLSVDGICGPKTWSALGFDTSDVAEPGRAINRLIVHCSATPDGEDYKTASINAAHKERNFSSYIGADGQKHWIGYHYLIHRDGRIEACRPESVKGQHVANYNTGSIGICYIGGCDKRSNPKWDMTAIDTRTPAQKESLIKLLKELKGRYPKATIHGHREFAAKACPSFDAAKEYKNL